MSNLYLHMPYWVEKALEVQKEIGRINRLKDIDNETREFNLKYNLILNFTNHIKERGLTREEDFEIHSWLKMDGTAPYTKKLIELAQEYYPTHPILKTDAVKNFIHREMIEPHE